jgi:FMN reductase
VRKVETAALVIAATPVFRGSYTGLFKHFFDFVHQYALANKPVRLVATVGSDRHAMVIGQALRPLLGSSRLGRPPWASTSATGPARPQPGDGDGLQHRPELRAVAALPRGVVLFTPHV